MRLDVNTDASIQLTAKLERLSRSAFPSAVRNTLNNAAFESKKLIPTEADKEFTIRQKNLFKTFTGVEKAKGFNVNEMESKVGLDSRKPKSDELIEGLATQETGGTLQGNKLIPHDKSRVGGNYAKKVRQKHLFKNIKIGDRRRKYKGSKYVLIKKDSGKGTVFESNGKKLTPIYTYIQSRTRNIKKRSFIAPSAIAASRKMPDFYKKNAEYQFRKAMRQ